MTVRKNQAQLTADEKRRFVNALLALKRDGRYDSFVSTHNDFIMSDRDDSDRVGHRSPSFLPWHRRFLIQFEQALQSVDASVALPYWDWTADRTPAASLWAPDFLGGTGRPRDGQVTDGAFAFSGSGWRINVRVDGRDFLRRSLGGGGVQLPTKAEVDSVLAMPVYDAPPWNSASDGFRNHLEGWRGVNLHNRVHVWVGGHMATGASPNDPVFWLHHAYVDRLWTQWQARHPNSPYLPAAGTRDVVDLRETMRPWGNVTPADMLDHTRYYTYDVAA
ncbi:tyrosinase MelC2 [Streptomyces spectabilis]|uniref:Tyrosinase n=1 Tax=Streptomyces spectabilis TaxID=68270 RepID=A0A5P2X742_STRST|nr:tyrosinase family protein [Streptomyces spectabilis]MBB5106414.1 tyrosinase [Streptomyces spectabilis]MCI3903023.1 tyrosinase family protein [Streptomyces spectabilis]QEV60278.1 tyrosinase family protein [Streptomyces spectabilis]GGV32839.1 tyrosinase [Streptomyces spectabilis]